MDGAQEDRKVGIDNPANTEESSRTDEMVSKVGKKANVQLSKSYGVGKESSKRKETGSPRKGVKGKKRGLNREIITLGGKKKQETSIRRKLKKKMNQKRGRNFSHQEEQGDHTTTGQSYKCTLHR